MRSIAAAFLIIAAAGLQTARAAGSSNEYATVYGELERMKSPHPWAGSYGGPGQQGILIAPSGRYCAATYYDMGPTVDADCGKLRLAGERFVTDGRPQKWELEDHNGPPYLRIPWGGRNYVVPERRILEFINGVNGAQEPRYDGAFGGGASGGYLRGRERSILVAGRPEVPEQYRALLREKALFATAVSISTRTNIVTRHGRIEIEDCGAQARFDAGLNSGAFVGMELHAQSSDVQASAILDAVDAESSTGRVKQYDCDRTDPLPERTVFSTRPRWNRDVVFSTTPLRIEIRFAGAKRYPPFFRGSAPAFYDEEPFEGAPAAGFRADKIAEVTFHGAFPDALSMKESSARRERAVLSLGGNLMIRHMPSAGERDAERGGIETERVKVYRLSYKGRPLEPSSYLHYALMRGSSRRGKNRVYDWNAAGLGAQAAVCGSAPVVADAERQAGLQALRWDEALLARAHELRFEDLNPEQRAAAEPLVPEELRTGFVWPALEDERSTFNAAYWKRGWEVEKEYKAAHPAEEAECRRLQEDAVKHITD